MTGISVIVPTYNERGTVEQVIDRCLDALSEYRVEVIVVDDDSPDGTYRAVQQSYADDARVRALRRTDERGLATAVVEGFEAATLDYYAVIDADLQHPPDVCSDLASVLDDGADVAIGSRYVDGGSVDEWSHLRRIVSAGETLLARAAVPETRSVSDPMSGFFAVRRSVVDSIELNPDGFKILLEILARGNYEQVVEVPYTFTGRDRGESKLSSANVASYVRHCASLAYDRFRHARSDRSASATDPAQVGVVSAFPPVHGNASEYCKRVVDELADDRVAVSVVAPRLDGEQAVGGEPSVESDSAYPVHRVWRQNSLRGVVAALNHVRRRDYDAVYYNLTMTTFGSRNLVRFAGLSLPLATRLFTGATIVTTLHDSLEIVEESALDRQITAIERVGAAVATQLLFASHALTVTSTEFKDAVTERYFGEAVHVPHGSFGRPSSESSSTSDILSVLLFGFVATHKEYETVFEAATTLRNGGEDVEVVVAGESHPDCPNRLAELEARYGDRGWISFEGYIPETEVSAVFEEASVVVLPYNTCTGVSGVYKLAQTHGVPAVVYETESMRTATVEQGGEAVFVPPGNQAALADRLHEMWTSPAYRSRLVEAGYDAAGQHTVADTADHVASLCLDGGAKGDAGAEWTSGETVGSGMVRTPNVSEDDD